MEEAMIHTEDSYGMDGKANLPSFTGDIDWQGLEDLYSVNESVYEYRYNYRLSLADWTNYLKDVDRMFALLNSYYQQNKTDKANTARSNRDGDESSTPFTLVEMTSAEESSGLPAEELQLIVPTDFAALALSTVNLSQERKLELNNDIPEKSSLNDAHWRNNHQAEKWMEDKESDRFDMDFSGNGLIELESRHSFMLQPISIPQKDTHQDSDAVEEIFEDQIYLPMRSDEPLVHQAVNVSIRDSSIGTQKTGPFLEKTEQSLAGETSQILNVEGSASAPLSLE
nr:PREDICTED: uncharacterized protein LOC104639323 [Balearica regulorum gibbericeps]